MKICYFFAKKKKEDTVLFNKKHSKTFNHTISFENSYLEIPTCI